MNSQEYHKSLEIPYTILEVPYGFQGVSYESTEFSHEPLTDLL